jgi:precorrin-6x reductase
VRTVLVFAGTSDARTVIKHLVTYPVAVHASVATTDGCDLLKGVDGVTIHVGRLDEKLMMTLVMNIGVDLVIDATHPYATEAHKTISSVCHMSRMPLLVLERLGMSVGYPVYPDLASIVDALQSTQGNVLVATGSKGLPAFSKLDGHTERVYARVLPTVEALEVCKTVGLNINHVIAMTGPFSRELNEALMRQLDIRHLVTKDSGVEGAFMEKLKAAEACDATVYVLARPTCKHDGFILPVLLQKIDRWIELSGMLGDGL